MEHLRSFSALQRAENSSIVQRVVDARRRIGFSALQRAENSSIGRVGHLTRFGVEFQCSSASRKFLNSSNSLRSDLLQPRFSALQRAENSSID